MIFYALQGTNIPETKPSLSAWFQIGVLMKQTKVIVLFELDFNRQIKVREERLRHGPSADYDLKRLVTFAYQMDVRWEDRLH